MPFQLEINGPMFKMFLESIATVASTPIITFGSEKITCNHFSEVGDLMVSVSIPPMKSNLQGPVSLKVDLEKLLEDIGESEFPEELIVDWSDKELVAFPNVEEADVLEEIYVFSQKCTLSPSEHPEAPRINYPLRFSIDHDVIKSYLSKLKTSSGIIISYENGMLYLATEDWSDRVEIPGGEFFPTKKLKGEYSSLFDRELLTSIIEAMGVFESISVALGEDLPLIIVGIDPGLKVGYMIAQQV